MLDQLIDRVGQIEEHASAKTIFGDPIREQGRTIIPVGKVRFGFGLGGGNGSGAGRDVVPSAGSDVQADAPRAQAGRRGGGGGGGARIMPVAVLEVTESGTTVRPIVDVTGIVLGGMALVAWNVFWIGLTVRTVARARRRARA